MKILELCTSDGVGGLELYALRSTAALQRLGHDVMAVVRPGTMLQQRLHEQGLAHFVLPRRSRALPLLAAWRLARLIDKAQVDVIHMHWGPDLFLAALAKRWASRPVRLVYTRQMALTRPKNDAYHRFLYRQIDLYLTITDKLLQQARQLLPLPAERIQRLYYGVPAPAVLQDAERRALRHSLQIPERVFAIGLIGRMEEQKGQHLLIEAVQYLRAAGIPAHATLIGPAMDAAYQQRLQREIEERGLQDAVILRGPHKTPMDIMPAFDVIVLTTRMETFGLVLAEAMRCGVAVVGTDAGGVPEIIEDGRSGLLFTPEDASHLARQLEHLARNDGLRRQLAAAGKARADDLFAEENHYRRLADTLLNVT
ncbi:glycosyltransferase family 4 protein [Sulfurivermis fontis]|uniref:glycosyltransferase family 4 protein n=1 Tax=Sulfurivermis fontis TaxID=1972068 RepID=UPI0015588908|nr:glycosyltransferase family 4 protein [Sulfurivermis fontis]